MRAIVKSVRRTGRPGQATLRAASRDHRLRCAMLMMTGITAHRAPDRWSRQAVV